MINEDTRSYNTEKVAIDFVESEDEYDNENVLLPKSQPNFIKTKQPQNRNKSMIN